MGMHLPKASVSLHSWGNHQQATGMPLLRVIATVVTGKGTVAGSKLLPLQNKKLDAGVVLQL